MNKIPRVIFIFFIILFACIAIAEITLRIIGYNYSPLRLEKLEELDEGLGKTDWRFHHAYYDDYCIYDRQLIWRPRSSYGIFNAQGFRGAELSPVKQAYECRIFVIGDSNSAGPIGRPGWPEYLQELYKKGKRGISVTNASCWGYTSYQGLKRFEEILKYKPDIVLISFGSNDAHRVCFSDEDYVTSKHLIPSGIAKFGIVQLGIALSDTWFVKKGGKLQPRVSLQNYRKNLEQIMILARANNIKIVFLTRPFIGSSYHPLWWKNFAPDYNSLTRKIAKENNAGLIDIYAEFKDKAMYFCDESHFNDVGFKLAAEVIYNYLKENTK